MVKAYHFIRPLATILLGTTLLLGTGCWLVVVGAVAATAAGSVAYVDGKLEASLGNSYESVVTATGRAISQLEFSKPEERRDQLSDTFVTYTAKGDHLEILVTKAGDNLTQVSIRVGTFGDQALSQTVLDKIKANL
jgi:hypothetical protein